MKSGPNAVLKTSLVFSADSASPRFFGSGGAARMNRPGTESGNWRWRLDAEALDSTLAARLAVHEDCPEELDAVALVDDEGRIVWDLPLLQLLVNPADTPLADLVGESDPVTVGIHAQVGEVAERLIEARRMSVVVVDDDDVPVGRILADDVIDALVPERGRIHFPRLLQ